MDDLLQQLWQLEGSNTSWWLCSGSNCHHYRCLRPFACEPCWSCVEYQAECCYCHQQLHALYHAAAWVSRWISAIAIPPLFVYNFEMFHSFWVACLQRLVAVGSSSSRSAHCLGLRRWSKIGRASRGLSLLGQEWWAMASDGKPWFMFACLRSLGCRSLSGGRPS